MHLYLVKVQIDSCKTVYMYIEIEKIIKWMADGGARFTVGVRGYR